MTITVNGKLQWTGNNLHQAKRRLTRLLKATRKATIELFENGKSIRVSR